jgi:hypothetical protein
MMSVPSGRAVQRKAIMSRQDRIVDIAACYDAAQRRVPSRAPASAIVYTLKRDTADEVAAALTRKGAVCMGIQNIISTPSLVVCSVILTTQGFAAPVPNAHPGMCIRAAGRVDPLCSCQAAVDCATADV